MASKHLLIRGKADSGRDQLSRSHQGISEEDGESKVKGVQDMDSNEHRKIWESILKMSHRRRKARMDRVQLKYTQAASQLRREADAAFQTYRAKVLKVRNAQLQKLDILLQRRRSLEEQISRNIKKLEASTKDLTLELKALLSERYAQLSLTGDADKIRDRAEHSPGSFVTPDR